MITIATIFGSFCLLSAGIQFVFIGLRRRPTLIDEPVVAELGLREPATQWDVVQNHYSISERHLERNGAKNDKEEAYRG